MSLLGTGNTADYYSIADNAALTLPASDWCIGVWAYLTSNTGTTDQCLLSNNNIGVNNNFNLSMRGSSSGTNPNKWRYEVRDGSANSYIMVDSVATGVENRWRLIVAQRRGANVELLTAPLGGLVRNNQTAITSLGAVNGGAWNIMRRTNASAAYQAGNRLGEIFIANYALDPMEIQRLALGLSILKLNRPPLVLYIPGYTNTPVLRDLAGGFNASRNGSPGMQVHVPLARLYPAVIPASASSDQTVQIGLASASAAGLGVAAQPGEVSRSVGLASATAVGLGVTAVPGEVTRVTGLANATAEGLSAAAQPGEVTRDVGQAAASAVGLSVTAQPGSVSRDVGLANAAAAGFAVTAQPGAVTRQVGLAAATAQGLTVVATLGGMVAQIGLAEATAQGLEVIAQPGGAVPNVTGDVMLSIAHLHDVTLNIAHPHEVVLSIAMPHDVILEIYADG